MNEEKDRYGDFIRLLERAREDVYFAEKDRELLEKLKLQLEKARRAIIENPNLKCPRCAVSLHNSTLIDFPINRCSTCGGAWLEGGVLNEVVKLKSIASTPTDSGLRG